jgi:hypothetical protein
MSSFCPAAQTVTFWSKINPAEDCSLPLMIWSPPPGQEAEKSCSKLFNKEREAPELIQMI